MEFWDIFGLDDLNDILKSGESYHFRKSIIGFEYKTIYINFSLIFEYTRYVLNQV